MSRYMVPTQYAVVGPALGITLSSRLLCAGVRQKTLALLQVINGIMTSMLRYHPIMSSIVCSCCMCANAGLRVRYGGGGGGGCVFRG